MSINKVLDHDIKVIKKSLIDMVDATEKQYNDTYKAITTNDYDLAKQVIKNDAKINKMQNDFTAMALWKIAKQQMVASDLRLAVGSIIISREIERIADYAKAIDKYLIDFKPDVKNLQYIKDNFHFVNDMLDMIKNLIDHYDTKLPLKVKDFEKEVDDEFIKARSELIKEIRSAKTDDEAVASYASLRQFKKLERAAEHIISIQEILGFIRTGKFDDDDKYKNIMDNYSKKTKKA